MNEKRQATIRRTTNETDISLTLTLEGQGRADVETGDGFLDHMLTLFASHGRFDLKVSAVGDLYVDGHHTVEDVGICLGQALTEALGEIPYAGPLATAILIFAVAAAFLLIGELLPIRVAEQKADGILYPLWPLLRFLAFLYYPLAFPVNLIVTLTIKAFGLKQDADEALTKDEIQTIVEESGDSGLLEEHERDMLEGIFDFNEKTADQVMTPRTEVFLIDGNAPLSEYMETMLSEKYSRIPVYTDEIDNIVGILYLKDFQCL